MIAPALKFLVINSLTHYHINLTPLDVFLVVTENV